MQHSNRARVRTCLREPRPNDAAIVVVNRLIGAAPASPRFPADPLPIRCGAPCPSGLVDRQQRLRHLPQFPVCV